MNIVILTHEFVWERASRRLCIESSTGPFEDLLESKSKVENSETSVLFFILSNLFS